MTPLRALGLALSVGAALVSCPAPPAVVPEVDAGPALPSTCTVDDDCGDGFRCFDDTCVVACFLGACADGAPCIDDFNICATAKRGSPCTLESASCGAELACVLDECFGVGRCGDPAELGAPCLRERGFDVCQRHDCGAGLTCGVIGTGDGGLAGSCVADGTQGPNAPCGGTSACIDGLECVEDLFDPQFRSCLPPFDVGCDPDAPPDEDGCVDGAACFGAERTGAERQPRCAVPGEQILDAPCDVNTDCASRTCRALNEQERICVGASCEEPCPAGTICIALAGSCGSRCLGAGQEGEPCASNAECEPVTRPCAEGLLCNVASTVCESP